MKYVLDSSVAFKWVVPEADSDKATQLRADFRNAVHRLLSPDIFPQEVAHALTRAERQRRIHAGQAALFWGDVMTTSPQLVPSLPLTQRAIAISSARQVGVFDCLYVALAEREGCGLVTADDRLIRNLQASFPLIVPLASLP